MKRTILIVLLFFPVFNISAQSKFSTQNLSTASQLELNDYLKIAKTNKTVGIVMTIAGPVMIGTIFLLAATDANISLDTAGALFLIGAFSTLAGIPVLVVNSARIKRINQFRNTVSQGMLLDIVPYSFHDNLAQKHHSGITLRLRF